MATGKNRKTRYRGKDHIYDQKPVIWDKITFMIQGGKPY